METYSSSGAVESVIQPPAPLSFRKQELLCEQLFNDSGPYWHLCTPGMLTELLFRTEEDYRFIMNQQAIQAERHDVRFLAFEVMSNHLHDVLEGVQQACLEFFAQLKRKLRRYFSGQGRYVNLDGFEPTLIPIDNLQMLRTEICYSHRNGFLVHPAFTPFSYPWGSGTLYFSPVPRDDLFPRYADLPDVEKRLVCGGRSVDLPVRFRTDRGLILPQTYVDYRKGMAMFRDAQHYFSMLSKNNEAYSETAKRLGDSIFLTDEEMFAALRNLCIKQFDEKKPTLLPNASKIELARQMRRDYNASEGQIQRMLRLDINLVRELFGKS